MVRAWLFRWATLAAVAAMGFGVAWWLARGAEVERGRVEAAGFRLPMRPGEFRGRTLEQHYRARYGPGVPSPEE